MVEQVEGKRAGGGGGAVLARYARERGVIWTRFARPPDCPTMVSCLHLIYFVTGGKNNDCRPNGRRISA